MEVQLEFAIHRNTICCPDASKQEYNNMYHVTLSTNRADRNCHYMRYTQHELDKRYIRCVRYSKCEMIFHTKETLKVIHISFVQVRTHVSCLLT